MYRRASFRAGGIEFLWTKYNTVRVNASARMAQKTDSFTSIQTAKIVGLSYRTIDHWARTSVLVPSLADTKGTGTERRYSFEDLVALCVARDLRSGGISLRALRSIVAELRKESSANPLSGARFFVVGSDVVMVRNCKEAFSVLRQPGQGVFAFMVDLSTTVSELRKSVEKERRAA